MGVCKGEERGRIVHEPNSLPHAILSPLSRKRSFDPVGVRAQIHGPVVYNLPVRYPGRQNEPVACVLGLCSGHCSWSKFTMRQSPWHGILHLDGISRSFCIDCPFLARGNMKDPLACGTYRWGVIYLRHQRPPPFDASKIQLFTVQ